MSDEQPPDVTRPLLHPAPELQILLPGQLSALSVVLGQPSLASDPLLLSSAARVCSSWRAAVAAPSAGTTDVIIRDTASDVEEVQKGIAGREQRVALAARLLGRVHGFGDWVVQHARLIRSLQLEGEAGDTACCLLEERAEALGSLQLPSLQEFSCRYLPNSAVLAALPCSLTRLDIAMEDDSTKSGAKALAKAVKGLTSLKSLRLIPRDCSACAEVLPVLQELPCLVQLELLGTMHDGAELHVLQKLLPTLTTLEVLLLDIDWEFENWTAQRRLNLGSLTALKQLSLQMCFSFRGAGVVLPAGLTELKLVYVYHEVKLSDINPIRDLKVRSLKKLCQVTLQLSLHPLVEFPQGVQSLEELRQLDRLDLEYTNIHTAHADCKIWPRLPSLAGICIDDDGPGVSNRGWAGVQEGTFSVLSQLREGLTRLEYCICSSNKEEAELNGEEVSLCRHVSSLTKLQRLYLTPYYGYPPARDCLQLSVLRGLTRLSLPYMHSGVDDTVAAVLVCNMPLLRHLHLAECGLQSDSLLAVLPRCEYLTQLVVSWNPGFGDDLLLRIDRWNRTGLPRFEDMLRR